MRKRSAARILLPALALCLAKAPASGQQADFLFGFNYPWQDYGRDFVGAADDAQKQSESDFEEMRARGARVARWFVFADGRAIGPGQRGKPGLDSALDAARKNGIRLILVLFDYKLADTAWGRKPIQDPRSRTYLIAKVLKPLLKKHAKDDAILAWEVMNEPEGAMAIPGGGWVSEPVRPEQMKGFVRDVVRAIHYWATQPATLGSGSRAWLPMWTASGLDLYQYHDYQTLKGTSPSIEPCSDLGLSKPVLVGEFPTAGTAALLPAYLDSIKSGGCAGALAWSYRAGDDQSDFKSAAAALEDWAKTRLPPPSS